MGVDQWKYKGACLSGYYAEAFDNVYTYRTIDYLKACGVNSIQIVVTWYQDDFFSTNIYPHPRYSIQDKLLEKIVQYIHKQGLQVNLNPHVDPYPDQRDWRARIVPADISKWFDSYRRFIEHYLRLAIKHQVALFTVGTELVSMTRAEYLTQWSSLIDFVRSYQFGAYQGKLTYLADRTEIFGMSRFVLGDNTSLDVKVLDAKFWDLFDCISMSAFYEVGDFFQATPSVSSLLQVWSNIWLIKLEYWKANLQLDKKVIIGEIGYRSIDYAHRAPWHFDVTSSSGEQEVFNEKTQANCYEAMFQAFNTIDWIDGLFLWEEVINSPPFFFDSKNTHFSIIHKEASQVVAKYYKSVDKPERIPGIPIRYRDLKRPLIQRIIRYAQRRMKALARLC